jgi:hypothetical protein
VRSVRKQNRANALFNLEDRWNSRDLARGRHRLRSVIADARTAVAEGRYVRRDETGMPLPGTECVRYCVAERLYRMRQTRLSDYIEIEAVFEYFESLCAYIFHERAIDIEPISTVMAGDIESVRIYTEIHLQRIRDEILARDPDLDEIYKHTLDLFAANKAWIESRKQLARRRRLRTDLAKKLAKTNDRTKRGS